jgi:hypothetical protein
MLEFEFHERYLLKRKLPVPIKTSVNEHAKGENVGLHKKDYQKPALKTYGPVKHLTQGTGGSRGDGGAGMSRLGMNNP